jgi:hypothetical protein
MASRHGRLARTPVSKRDPAVLVAPTGAARAPAVPIGRERASREELLHPVPLMFNPDAYYQQRWRLERGMNYMLDWLETFPGDTWQDRWLLSGSDQLGTRWGPEGLSQNVRATMTLGLRMLIVFRVIRPSYEWLFGSRSLGVYADFRRFNQADTFAEIERGILPRDSYQEYAAEALNLLTRMVIVTGKDLRALTLRDFDDYATARWASGRNADALALAYELLHGVGGLAGLASTLRQARSRGQLSVAELVDKYPIVNREIRDVLVHYLVERSAVIDYGLPRQPGPGPGGRVLGRPRTSPPGHRLAAAARRGRRGLEETDPQAARWATAPQRTLCLAGCPLALFRSAAVVTGRSRAVGAMGGALPDP